MNKSSKIWMSVTVAAAVLSLGSLMSQADEMQGKCEPRPAHFEGHGPHGGFAGGPLPLRGLDLTDDQKTKVKQIFEQQKNASEEKFKALRDSYKALHEASKAEPYDAKKVQDIAAQQASLQAELTVMRTDAMHQVYTLLTPEQKKKWDEKPRHPDGEHDKKRERS